MAAPRAPYTLWILPAAGRELRALGADWRAKVDAKILTLAENPRPHGSKKLAGSKSTYRVRVADYRIVYEIDDTVRTVTVSHVLDRKDAYR